MIRAYNARIIKITKDQNNYFVTISSNDSNLIQQTRSQTVVLVVNRNTRIVDENKRSISPRQLNIGMFINAIFSERMTKSIPPQSIAFYIGISKRNTEKVSTRGRIILIDNANNFINIKTVESPFTIIRLNLLPNTIITGPLGIRLSVNDLFPGLLIEAIHANFMTASIPPQTPVYRINVDRLV